MAIYNVLKVSLLFCNSHRKFIGYDLPTAITKSAPDYSSVYVISKGKIVSARSALRPMTNMVASPKRVQPITPNDTENRLRSQEMKLTGNF